MISISVLYPEESRQTMQIPKAGLLIGRSQDCNLCLTDEFISAKHCKIFFENGELFIEDLGSTNGTFIDGVQLEKKTSLGLGHGVQIGATVLKIV